MKKVLLVGLGVILLASCGANVATKAGQPEQVVPLTDSEKAYITRIEEDGRLMYEKDIRAAQATDLLLAKINPADYPNFVGWVTYPNEDDFTVSFYEKTVDGFKVISDVKFSRQVDPALNLNPARAPNNQELSMLNARLVALEKGVNGCSDRFNTVVLPSQNEAHWDVYVLAATTNPKLVQVGGHVKVTVLKNTAEVVDIMPLSKSCLALDKSGEGLPEGASLSALSVSHHVSLMPVAIHPYLNLLHDIALVVSSERGLWMIRSGRFEKL